MRILALALTLWVANRGLGTDGPVQDDSQKEDRNSSVLSNPLVKEAARQLDFQSWPGKRGQLKPGFKLVPTDFPQLAGFTVSSDLLTFKQIGNFMTSVRSLELTNDAQQVFIDLQVSQESTNVVQEALLIQLSQAQIGVTGFQRGDRRGLQIGDLNFLDGTLESLADGTKITPLMFVRNNIGVSLGKSSAPSLDLKALAQGLDEKIKLLQGFTPRKERSEDEGAGDNRGGSALKPFIPRITAFQPLSKTIAPLSSTSITLTFTDPQGLTLQVQLFSSLGRIQRDETVTPPTTTFLSDTETGKATLTVGIINNSLLFAAAQTDLEVK